MKPFRSLGEGCWGKGSNGERERMARRTRLESELRGSRVRPSLPGCGAVRARAHSSSYTLHLCPTTPLSMMGIARSMREANQTVQPATRFVRAMVFPSGQVGISFQSEGAAKAGTLWVQVETSLDETLSKIERLLPELQTSHKRLGFFVEGREEPRASATPFARLVSSADAVGAMWMVCVLDACPIPPATPTTPL